jgi:hypothetical protein
MSGDAGRASLNDAIRITTYEDWMLPQVIDLICAWYGGRAEDREKNFIRFFDHPFQRDRAIRLAAIDAKKVVGFQSYFYWPYCFGETRLVTFQSGASLVAADYRGRKIFARLLNHHVHGPKEKMPIDFLMGFPVEMSFDSFLRNGWQSPLDLTWYAKVIHPLSVLSRVDCPSLQLQFEKSPEFIEVYHPNYAYSLTTDREFDEWRRLCRGESLHRYFHHSCPAGRIRFDLKVNQRGRIVELIIGNVLATTPDVKLFDDGIKALIKLVRKHWFIAILTTALNRSFEDDILLNCLRKRSFFRLKPKIHFIVKDVNSRRKDLRDAARWRLFRSDVDTW